MDPEKFVRDTDPFRPELLAHCYRMLGSMHDAEDQLQETFLRAWRSRAEFQGRSSLRTWLYRIATNVCLTELERRGRRPRPVGHPGQMSDRADSWHAPAEHGSAPWKAATAPDDPAAVVESRQHRRDALAVVWQRLSARRRAVLILHDVLNWPALDIAGLLEMSDTAVHSMLRRARQTLGQVSAGDLAVVARPDESAVLTEYATAFETGDLATFVSLLTEDAVIRAAGEEAFGRADLIRLMKLCPGIGRSRVVPIKVRDNPGFGIYRADEAGTFRASCVDVLTLSSTGIRRIEVLDDRSLFPALRLPLVYRGSRADAA